MFNKNIFFSHTTNTTNHNKMTLAGVKAPFSVNEQSLPQSDSGRSLARERRKKLNTYLNATDSRRYASTNNRGVLKGPNSFGTQGDMARAAIKDNQQTLTRELEGNPDKYRGMSPDEVEADFFGRDQYMTVPHRGRNVRTVPAHIVSESSGYPGSGKRARNTPRDRLRKAVAKQYNIPLEEVPEHTSHKQFVDDTHERHGKTIGNKDDFMNFVVDTLDAYSYDS